MNTYKKIIIGGVAIAGLVGLFGCSLKDHTTQKKESNTIEQKVTNPVQFTPESDSVSKNYDFFYTHNNLFLTGDEIASTAANLTLLSSLTSAAPEKFDSLYNKYAHSIVNLGFSNNALSQTATLLVYATTVNPKYTNPDKILSDYRRFYTMDHIGFYTQDESGPVAATFAIASALNNGNTKEIIELFQKFSAKNNLGQANDQVAMSAMQLTLASIIKENGYKLKK